MKHKEIESVKRRKTKERHKHNERIGGGGVGEREINGKARGKRVKLEDLQLHEECSNRTSEQTPRLSLNSPFGLGLNKY
jgi:hypothetical protein